MKLVFSKNEKQEISVLRKQDDETKKFNYIEMIKSLIKSGKLEDPEIDGDFSELEKNSIRNMIGHINTEVAEFNSDE